MLGALLMELTQELLGEDHAVPEPSQESGSTSVEEIQSYGSQRVASDILDPDQESLDDATTSTQCHTPIRTELCTVTDENDRSGFHVSRPKVRSSSISRKPCNVSTSGSRCRGTNRDVTKKMHQKLQQHQQDSTPRKDIRDFMAKRKHMESSPPENPSDCKTQKQGTPEGDTREGNT